MVSFAEYKRVMNIWNENDGERLTKALIILFNDNRFKDDFITGECRSVAERDVAVHLLDSHTNHIFGEYVPVDHRCKWLTLKQEQGIDPLKGFCKYLNSLRNNVKEEETMSNIINNNATESAIEESVTTCAICGCIIEEGDDHIAFGDHYCEDCFDEHFDYCAECGELVDKDDAYCDDSGDYYCNDCSDEIFAECAQCGSVGRIDDMIFIEGEDNYYCNEDCASRNHRQCDRCGEWVSTYSTYTVHVDYEGSTEEWCESCTDHNTHICDCCGDTYSDDVEFDEEYYCPYCSSRHNHQRSGDIKLWRAPRGVQSYCYKPDPCFCLTEDQNIEDKPILLGFELEVDEGGENSDTASFVNDTSGYTYTKHDGSLDEGFEIVSHPATIEYHMAKKETWSDIFDELLASDYTSHNAKTCGLHVHISLDSLESRNPLAVNNMLFIMDHFWDNFVKFSRRTESMLSRWCRRYSTYHGDYELLKKQAKDTRERYYALNLQNKHTVEVRMFRGTLNINTFIATLQFVRVFAEKACDIKNLQELQAISWEELVQSDYEELNIYLKKRGLLGSDEDRDAAISKERELMSEAQKKREELARQRREEQERIEAERQELLAYAASIRERRDAIDREVRNMSRSDLELRYPINARVRCIAPADHNTGFVGRYGRIIKYKDPVFDSHLPILVHFDETDPFIGHEGEHEDGTYFGGYCWWCEASALEIVSE